MRLLSSLFNQSNYLNLFYRTINQHVLAGVPPKALCCLFCKKYLRYEKSVVGKKADHTYYIENPWRARSPLKGRYQSM